MDHICPRRGSGDFGKPPNSPLEIHLHVQGAGGSSTSGNGGGGGVAAWLEALYTSLSGSLRDHRAWCGQVFPDQAAGVLMCEILVDVLASLDPSLDFCVEVGREEWDHSLRIHIWYIVICVRI